MKKAHKIWLLSGILVILSFVTISALFACKAESAPTQTPVNEGEPIMKANEEIMNANAAILLEHFEEIGLSEEYRSREGRARGAAGYFGEVSNSRIVKAESEVYKNGDLNITITVEEGSIFIIHMGVMGDVGSIKDGDGNLVLRVVM